MKKILLTLILLNSLALCDQSLEDKKKQINLTKQKIEELQTSLKVLEASLPKQIKRDKGIKTHAEFGYVNNKGNTNAESFTLDAKIKKTWNKHSLNFSVDSEYTSDDGEDTKNKYLLELTYDYKLTQKLFFLYLTGYKYDEFSGYDYQAYTGPGLNYIAVDLAKHKLELGSNILYSIDKAQDTQETYKYISYRAKAFYSWQILENLKFEEKLTYRTDLSQMNNFFVFSKTAFISKLTDIFSVSLSYKIDYVNKPEDDKKTSDRTMGANLIADF